MDFQLELGYNDINCDVRRDEDGGYSADLVIQHHDMVITNSDIGTLQQGNKYQYGRIPHFPGHSLLSHFFNGDNLQITNIMTRAQGVVTPRNPAKLIDRDQHL